MSEQLDTSIRTQIRRPEGWHPERTRRSEPLESAVTSFLEYLRSARRLARATIEAYGRDLRLFLDFVQRDAECVYVDGVASRDIDEWAAQMGGAAVSTVVRRLSALSSFYRRAVKLGYVPSNPVDGVERPRNRPRRMPCFTDEDLGQLLAAARKPIEKATILAFATTGARRSELRGVRVDDVDLDRRRILIHGKGGKDREVVISPELLKVLMARICGGDARPGGFLFPSRTGRELCNSTLQRWFTRLIKQAGLEGRGFTIHTLRRYAATRWHRSGVRLRNIQVLLGHESLDTTQRYLSVDLDEAQKQLDELEPLEHEVEVPYPSERAVG